MIRINSGTLPIGGMINLLVCIVFILLSSVDTQYIQVPCLRGWVDHKGTCYKFTRTPTKNRDEAFSKCRDYGAELVSINTEEEHKFIVDWLRSHDPQHKLWYTSGNLKNGVWYWDGDEVNSQFSNIDNLWLNDRDKEQSTGADAVYKYSRDVSRWGISRIDGFQKLAYICEIRKEKLMTNRVFVEERGPDFGIIVTDEKLIPRAPKFIVEPVDAVFDTSSRNQIKDVKLRCIADGYPYPEYKWLKEEFKNNEVVKIIVEPLKNRRLTQTDGTLNIHDPQQSDLGNYHCLAQNKFGTAVSKSVQLSFGFIAEFSKARSSETGRAYWGKALYCDPPNHYPDIQYNWARQEFPHFVQEDKRLFVSRDGNLYFTSLEKSDAATYSCNVQSVISSTGRTGPFFTLSVSQFSSSQVLQFPNNFPKAFPEVPLAGQDVRLECVAFGFPVPSYSWARQGANRQLPPKAQLLNHNRVLMLPKISVEDTGEYICTASNSQSSIQSSVSLDIRANPIFTIPLEDQFLDAGSELSWLCEAFGNPEVSYMWLKNGQELKIDKLPDQDRDRYKIDENMLTIQYLDERRDQGVYQCKAYNPLAATYSSAWLRVLSFSPTFQKYPIPAEMYAVIGGNITIPCHPEGAPKPTYMWRRNGIVIGNSGTTRILNSGYLQIQNVRRSDEGTYSCRAKNDLGEDQSSGQLIVLNEPKMVIRPQDKNPLVNSSINLPCQAGNVDSNLEMTYVWLKNGVPISPARNPLLEQVEYPSYLRFHHVSHKHSGVYTCVIKTPLKTISQSVNIQVVGPPGAPGGLSAANPTRDSIELRWTNGAINGAPIYGYIIEGKSNHLSEWDVIIANLSSRVVSRTVRGLQYYTISGKLSPYSSYRFRIRTINRYGSSPPSQPSPQYNTRGAKPKVYPRNVGGGGGKIGDLTITWTPLTPDEWNAGSVWYIVYWKEKGSEAEFFKNDLKRLGNIELFAETVGSQNFYKQYLVRVQAVNEYGAGPISPEVLIWSAENLPDATPDQVKMTAFNSTAMNVTWTPIRQNRETIRGTLVGYRIKYWIGNDLTIIKFPEKAETLFVRGAKPWGLVVGLKPNTWYVMTVSVYNNAGSGAMSEPTSYYTFKKAPNRPPTGVKLRPLSKTSILVSWRYVTPTVDEEPIVGYKVRYWENDNIRAAKDVYKYKNDGELEAQVTGLVPGQVYTLRVLAHSQGGDGKMSAPKIEFCLACTSSGNMVKSLVAFVVTSLAISKLVVITFT